MRHIRAAFWLPAFLVLMVSGALWAAEGGGVAPEGSGISVFQVIRWGGIIGYVIILLSVLTLMLVTLHIFSLRKSVFYPTEARDRIAGFFRERKLKDAVAYARKERSLLSRVIVAGLSRIRGGYPEMEQIMNDVAEDEAMRLEQSVGYFSLLAAISPLCGLLGTVVGMIAAFNEISMKGVVTPKELADPIQKALVTTCFGLIVAIPNVIAFTFFRNRLHRLLAEVGLVVEELLMPFRGLKAMPAKAAAAKKTAPPAPEPPAEEAVPEAEAAPSEEEAEAETPPEEAGDEGNAEAPEAEEAPGEEEKKEEDKKEE